MSTVDILLHGGKLDGFKKGIGMVLVLASELLTASHPEIAVPLRQIGEVIGAWGLTSDTAKAAAKVIS